MNPSALSRYIVWRLLPPGEALAKISEEWTLLPEPAQRKQLVAIVRVSLENLFKMAQESPERKKEAVRIFHEHRDWIPQLMTGIEPDTVYEAYSDMAELMLGPMIRCLTEFFEGGLDEWGIDRKEDIETVMTWAREQSRADTLEEYLERRQRWNEFALFLLHNIDHPYIADAVVDYLATYYVFLSRLLGHGQSVVMSDLLDTLTVVSRALREEAIPKWHAALKKDADGRFFPGPSLAQRIYMEIYFPLMGMLGDIADSATNPETQKRAVLEIHKWIKSVQSMDSSFRRLVWKGNPETFWKAHLMDLNEMKIARLEKEKLLQPVPEEDVVDYINGRLPSSSIYAQNYEIDADATRQLLRWCAVSYLYKVILLSEQNGDPENSNHANY